VRVVPTYPLVWGEFIGNNSLVYLRPATRYKNGKPHTYWRLVRSVRSGRRVRQETVAYLGELNANERRQANSLALKFSGRAEQNNLYEAPLPETANIRIGKVGMENSRSFGEVWLGLTLWRALTLDALCEELLPEGREEISWATMASVLVIARLCEPSSELHIAQEWYKRTALQEILGLPPEKVNDDRLYRALDQLLPHKEKIEAHLKARFGELFKLEYDLLLYDVTSTYFEGLAENNEQAQRGYSRDNRGDCKQVCIALVVTREGIPLGYEVFDGNTVDVTTVEHIVGTMEKRFGLAGRVWCMDRGMCSAKNIAWLQSTGRKYIIGAPKSELKKWQQSLAETRDWETVREGLEVKRCASPDGSEVFILCRSADRREKEKAMHEKFQTRIEDALKRMAGRLEKARRKLDPGVLERQIGRLLERNGRAAGRYEIEVKEDADCAAGLRLSWQINADWDGWATLSEGAYLLRTNIPDWDGPALWQAYTQLTQAEAAFRIQKSELSIRPVWHQKKERVQAHIFVCFLAYALWKTLEKWMQEAGLGNSPRTLLDEMKTIPSADIVLPLADHPGRNLRIRCVVKPGKAQAVLLARMGIKLPERLAPIVNTP